MGLVSLLQISASLYIPCISFLVNIWQAIAARYPSVILPSKMCWKNWIIVKGCFEKQSMTWRNSRMVEEQQGAWNNLSMFNTIPCEIMGRKILFSKVGVHFFEVYLPLFWHSLVFKLGQLAGPGLRKQLLLNTRSDFLQQNVLKEFHYCKRVLCKTICDAKGFTNGRRTIRGLE